MKLRDRFALIRKAIGVPDRRHQFSDDVVFELFPSQEEAVARATQETYMRTYQSISSAFDGVNIIAENAAEVPLKLWRQVAPGKKEEVLEHPILDLISDPNKLLTRFQLIEATFAYLLLTGHCYWFLEGANDHPVARRIFGDEPIKIHVERPDFVEVESPRGTEQIIFKRKVNGDKDRVQTVPAESVIYFRLFNPLSIRTGLPPLAAAQNSLIMELYLDVFGKGFYKNAIVPSSVFTTDGDVSNVTFERFRARMEREYQGIEKAHQMVLLSGGIKPVDMRISSPADSDFVQSSELTRDRIFYNLGVYHLAAQANNASGDAIAKAYRIFWQDTMQPKLKRVAEVMTKYLLPKYPGSEKLSLAFDTRQVAGMREDLMDESLALFRMVQIGIMSHQEAREFRGMPRDIPEGDTTGLATRQSDAVSRFVSNEERAFVEEQAELAGASGDVSMTPQMQLAPEEVLTLDKLMRRRGTNGKSKSWQP